MLREPVGVFRQERLILTLIAMNAKRGRPLTLVFAGIWVGATVPPLGVRHLRLLGQPQGSVAVEPPRSRGGGLHAGLD